MAQSGFTPISLYYSSVGGNVPVASNLVNGELALNIADGILFYKDNFGVVKQFTSGGGGGSNIVTTDFTATAGQTFFAVTYTVGQIEVYRNGIKLAKADFTATNGTSFILASPAAAGDLIEAVTFTAVSGGAVSSFSAGTTGLTPAAASTGAITLGGVLGIANGGTGNSTGAARSVTTSNFTIAEVANVIVISHLGTPVVSIDSLGNIKSLAGVSAYTTP